MPSTILAGTAPVGAGRPDTDDPFPSFEALRARHIELSHQRAASVESSRLWRDVEAFLGQARATGARIEDDDERAMAQAMVNLWAGLFFRERGIEADVTLAEFSRRPARLLGEVECPYPGLVPFGGRANDVRYFLGRWPMIREAVKKLEDGKKLIAFVGHPAVGKSSLISAGVLPKLRSGEAIAGSERWRYAGPVAPGLDPLARIVEAIRPDLATDPEVLAREVRRMLHDPGHLASLAGEPGDAPVVLVVDPFDEVFAAPSSPRALSRRALRAAVEYVTRSRREGRIRALGVNLARLALAGHIVLLVMRRDDAVRVRTLGLFEECGQFDEGLIAVTPPGGPELREMVEGPARDVGLKFDEGVVEALVRDVVGDPFALPLLQYALTRLWAWSCHSGDRVTWDAYHELGGGGARMAIDNRGKAFYDGQDGPGQSAAMRVLLRLVRPGPDRTLLFERLPRAALSAPEPMPSDLTSEPSCTSYPAPDDAPTTAAIDGLIREGLARETTDSVGGPPLVELASEVVVDRWRRLAVWMQEARSDDDRRRLTLGFFAATAAATLILTVAFLLRLAYVRREDASREKQIAVSRQLVVHTYVSSYGRLDLSLLLGQEAWSHARAFNRASPASSASPLLFADARNALLFTLNASPHLDRFLLSAGGQGEDGGKQDWVSAVVEQSPDGLSLAVARRRAESQYDIALWRRDDRLWGPPKPATAHHQSGSVRSLAFSPDGRTLTTGGGRFGGPGRGFDSLVVLWDVSHPGAIDDPTVLTGAGVGAGEGRVVRLAFSPDGTRLASITESLYRDGAWVPGVVRLWDVSDRRKPRSLGVAPGHCGPGLAATSTLGLAFSPDGHTLASGGGAGQIDQNGDLPKGRVAFWDVDAFPRERGPQLTVESPPQAGDRPRGRTAVCGLAYGSPARHTDGRGGPILAIGCLDGSIALIDIDPVSGARLNRFLANPSGPTTGEAVRSLALSPDGRQLAAGRRDASILLWDWDRDGPGNPTPQRLLAHLGDVLSLAFECDGRRLRSAECDGRRLRSASRDETWIRWDLTTPNTLAQCVRVASPMGRPNVSAAFRPAGRPGESRSVLASTDGGRNIVLWSVPDRDPKGFGPGWEAPRPIARLEGHEDRICDLSFPLPTSAASHQILASAGRDRRVLFWDLGDVDEARPGQDPRGLRPSAAIERAHGDQINCLRFDMTGKILATGSDDGMARLWQADPEDLAHTRLLATIANLPDDTPYLDEDAPHVLAPVLGLAFSTDKKTMATAHSDWTIWLWDISDPTRPRPRCGPLVGHGDAVLCVAFSRHDNGRRLASGGKDHSVLIWDLSAIDGKSLLQPCHTLNHHGAVRSVAFSRDGKWLASASDGDAQNLRLWDVAEIVQKRSLGPALVGHTGGVHRVAFDLIAGADARRDVLRSERLASAGLDGRVLVWKLEPEEGWRNRAHEAANRDLTDKERATFFGLK